MSNNLDYSPHIIACQHKIKSMYTQLLAKNVDKALEEGNEALVELRMALIAVHDIREKTRARS